MTITQIPVYVGFLIIIVAFFCEYVDTALGMGYGTILTPVLIIIGFEPFQIVTCVLISEFLTGAAAGVFHVLFKNIKIGTTKSVIDVDTGEQITTTQGIEIASTTERETRVLSRKLTADTNIVLLLSMFGIVGVVAASVLSILFSRSALGNMIVKIYISVMVISMGAIILMLLNRDFAFSFKKIMAIGAISGFNKGISAGGYGPLVMAGQVVSGVDGRNAVGNTSIAESIVSLAGIVTAITTSLLVGIGWGDFTLLPWLAIGGIASTPFAAWTTKKLKSRTLKLYVGLVTLGLGTFTFIRIFF